HHGCTHFGGRQSCGHPGWTTTGDEHICVSITFFIDFFGRVLCYYTAMDEAAQHLLVHGTKKVGLDESLVVKPGAQKSATELIDSANIVFERWPRVLLTNVHEFFDKSMCPTHVRLIIYLHDCARIVQRTGEHAARAMQFHATGKDAFPSRG